MTEPPDRRDAHRFLSRLDESAVVELTRAMVRLPSVNEAGRAEQPVAELVAATMRSFGWPVEVVEAAPGRPNVIAVVTGAGPGRTLMFEGHSDVVTAGDPAGWSFDPFGAELVDGRILGRGAADMKGGVAAMIHAARAAQLGGVAGRIVVGVLADEEGMMLGAKAFARSELAAGIDGVIVCEPEGGEICPASKGAIRLRVDVAGVMAHGAMPQVGRNPIPVLGRLLLALEELGQQLRARNPAHPQLGEFYLTPTVLTAGSTGQVNVIPATASVLLDLRTIPGIDHPGLIALVRMVADQVAGESGTAATVTVLDDRPPVDLRRDAPVVRALADAHELVTGEPPVFGGVPGTTDGTILTRDAGLDTVVYGPGGKWIAHSADEFVEVDDLLRCARVYTLAAATFLGTP